MKCVFCEEEILPHELVGDADGKSHHECAFRRVAGSVAHQQRRCSCYGGTGEDDPNLTGRENARASLEHFRAVEKARGLFDEKVKDTGRNFFDDDTTTGYHEEDYPEICSGCDHPEDWCVCNQKSY